MPTFGTSASRLRKHADYQRVYASSRKQFSKQMSFFFCVRAADASATITGPRVGLTVGKVMGKAVDRNRIKRRLREVIRKNAQALRLLPVDVVLHPRRAVIDLDFEALDREVASVFRTIQDRVAKQQPQRTDSVAPGAAAQ